MSYNKHLMELSEILASHAEHPNSFFEKLQRHQKRAALALERAKEDRATERKALADARKAEQAEARQKKAREKAARTSRAKLNSQREQLESLQAEGAHANKRNVITDALQDLDNTLVEVESYLKTDFGDECSDAWAETIEYLDFRITSVKKRVSK